MGGASDPLSSDDSLFIGSAVSPERLDKTSLVWCRRHIADYSGHTLGGPCVVYSGLSAVQGQSVCTEHSDAVNGKKVSFCFCHFKVLTTTEILKQPGPGLRRQCARPNTG